MNQINNLENQSLGEFLRIKRQEIGMSIEEVSIQLNVKKSDIEFLEKDSFNLITKHLYLIGLIKSYGKILKINNITIEEKIKNLHFNCNTKNKKHQLIGLDKESLKTPDKNNITNAILISIVIYLLLMFFDYFKLYNKPNTDLIINNMNQAK
jgi:cytoskeletal protein RodZ